MSLNSRWIKSALNRIQINDTRHLRFAIRSQVIPQFIIIIVNTFWIFTLSINHTYSSECETYMDINMDATGYTSIGSYATKISYTCTTMLVLFDLHVNVRNKSACSYIYCNIISIPIHSNLLEMMHHHDQVPMHHYTPPDWQFIKVKFSVCFKWPSLFRWASSPSLIAKHVINIQE